MDASYRPSRLATVLAARKPVLACIVADAETREVLGAQGACCVADPTSEKVHEQLDQAMEFLQSRRYPEASIPAAIAERESRSQAARLARLFTLVAEESKK